jgi:putative transposase
MQTVETLAAEVGVHSACEALVVPRSSLYATRQPKPEGAPRPATPPPNALTALEKTAVLAELNSDRFADQTPYEVYPQLLDEGRYLCSLRGMYRILAENQAVRDRRDQLHHPARPAPRVLARRPNQVWVWDITLLLSTVKYQCFYLYLVLDLFSRFVVGWLIAERENAALAERLIAESCARQNIPPSQLRLHSDRGGPMTAKPLALLFADLGLTQSLARPRTPDDNAYSEAQFKTLKYHPTYPGRFGGLLDARGWGQRFFPWYNYAHHHTGLGLMTPAMVHYGLAPQIHQQQQQVLACAYAAHPERFVKGLPQPPALPAAVWLNPPEPGEKVSNDSHDLH